MKTLKSPILLLISLILFLISLPCCTTPSSSPVYEKNGKVYGEVRGTFRHRWWNYYERALSYANGEYYPDAIKDIKEAVQQRESDQRMARTYGMHFIDYFPHRELGVIYYHMGQYEDAATELEKSLSTVETGRAIFYLNLTRKVLTERSGLDILPPNIHTLSVSDETTTNRFRLKMEGVAEDDSYVSRISINHIPLFIERYEKKIPFTKELRLKKGRNEITISTHDILDKNTEKKITVFADFEGPTIRIDNYYDGQEARNNTITLKGRIADATGLAGINLNGQALNYSGEKDASFQFSIDLKQGSNRISFEAVDTPGNTTRGELNISYKPAKAKINYPAASACVAYFTPPSLTLPTRGGTFKPPFNKGGLGGFATLHHLHDKKKPILVAYNGNRLFVSTEQNTNNFTASSGKPPSALKLILKDFANTQTVYLDKIYIDGSAIGNNTIRSITINNDPLLIIPGRTIYFNQLIELKEGENQLTFKAQDVKRATVSRTITIIRKIPKVRQIGSRMGLAILPFEETGVLTPASRTAQDLLEGAFINQERFYIVSQGKAWDAILKEQDLSQTDLVDSRTAVSVGKLVAAEAVLTGTVHETDDFIEIFARIIDTETSTVMDAMDVYGQDKSFDHIKYISNGLALKFKQSFPLLEGLVIKVQKKDITVDLGREHGIKKGIRFIVFREDELIVNPDTHIELGKKTMELGTAKVDQVFDVFSIGNIVTNIENEEILVKDMVITK